MAERPTYPKSSCCVPFCRRTSRRFKEEWICGEHWKLVPQSLKRFRTRRLKEIDRAGQKAGPDLDAANERGVGAKEAYFRLQRIEARWLRVERATWRRMKRIAIERATGI